MGNGCVGKIALLVKFDSIKWEYDVDPHVLVLTG